MWRLIIQGHTHIIQGHTHSDLKSGFKCFWLVKLLRGRNEVGREARNGVPRTQEDGKRT
ncbi:hypothetical protein ACFLS1_12075 [Verrucomicrobiota bacterium]